MNDKLVRDSMSAPAITVMMDTRVSEAQDVMRDHNIHRLPVVDQFGKLRGIVTRVNLGEVRPPEVESMSFTGMQIALRMMTVGDMMTKDPITISPQKTLCQAAKVMLNRHISGLPVVERGRLVGIIADSDIFRELVKDCAPAARKAKAKPGSKAKPAARVRR